MDSPSIIVIQPKPIDSYRISKRLFADWRSCEAMCAIFAMIGIFVGTLNYEYTYSTQRSHDNCRINHMILNPLKIVILITTIVSLFYFLLGIYHKLVWEAYMNCIYSGYRIKTITYSNIFNSMSWYQWIEFLLLLIFPYPSSDFNLYLPLRFQFKLYTICYNFSEICYLIMLLRIVIVLRAISLFSPYEDHLARNYCRKYKVPADARFGIKCLIAQYPLRVITLSAVTGMILLATMFRILERPVDDLTVYYYSYYLNALWFLFENMSTLGYGEFLPVTDLGRVISVFGYFIGTSLFSLMVLTLEDKLNLNIQQSKAFTKIFKINVAADAIKAGITYFVIKKKYGKRSTVAKIQKRILSKKCKEMKNKRVEIEELSKGNDEAIIEMKICVSIIGLKMKKADRMLDGAILVLKEDIERAQNAKLL